MEQIRRGERPFRRMRVFLALLVSAVFMLISGYNPLESYGALVEGSFGSISNIATTLGIATPLILSGLSVSLAYKGGFLNVGVESQLLIGAFVAAVVGTIPGIPSLLHIPLCFVSAMAAGGLLGMLCAYLKRVLNVSELIITVLINYIVEYLVGYLVTGPFAADSKLTRTNNMMDSARIPMLVENNRLSSGIFLAILCALFVWWLLYRTRKGYEIRASGLNPTAAAAAGISPYGSMYFSMLISGGLAALGGAIESMGFYGNYIATMVSGYGFSGLTMAIMGGFSSTGCVITSILFGALRAGSSNMNRSTNIPGEFITVLQALVILLVASPRLIRIMKTAFTKAKKERG